MFLCFSLLISTPDIPRRGWSKGYISHASSKQASESMSTMRGRYVFQCRSDRGFRVGEATSMLILMALVPTTTRSMFERDNVAASMEFEPLNLRPNANQRAR